MCSKSIDPSGVRNGGWTITGKLFGANDSMQLATFGALQQRIQAKDQPSVAAIEWEILSSIGDDGPSAGETCWFVLKTIVAPGYVVSELLFGK